MQRSSKIYLIIGIVLLLILTYLFFITIEIASIQHNINQEMSKRLTPPVMSEQNIVIPNRIELDKSPTPVPFGIKNNYSVEKELVIDFECKDKDGKPAEQIDLEYASKANIAPFDADVYTLVISYSEDLDGMFNCELNVMDYESRKFSIIIN